MSHSSRKPALVFALSSTVSLFLSACNGGGGAGESSVQSVDDGLFFHLPADKVSRLGTVLLTSVNGHAADALGVSTGIVTGYAEFADYADVMSADYIAATYGSGARDTCKVEIYDPADAYEDGRDAKFQAFDASYKSVSAGETLSFTTPAGSWSEMVLDVEYDEYYYGFQNQVSSLGDLPPGSALHVPGAEFPAFENLTVPTVERFSQANLSNVMDTKLTASTGLTWSRSMQANASGAVRLTLETDVPTLVNDATNEYQEVFIACTLSDDGEFQFPDDIKALMAEHDFVTEDVYLARYNSSTTVKGNAAVVVLNVAEFVF